MARCPCRRFLTHWSGEGSYIPFYYDFNKACTTNGSANTLSTHFRFATVANQLAARLMKLMGAGRSTTAGGGQLRLIRAGTIGSGGTSYTLAKAAPDNPVASTTAFDDNSAITPGASPKTHFSVGWAQQGGTGLWMASEVDEGKMMKPNGAADGNLEVATVTTGTGVAIDISGAVREG